MSFFSRIVLLNARVNLTTSQRLCRPFTSSVLRPKKHRAPRPIDRQQPRYDEDDQYEEIHDPPPPKGYNPGTIVCGGIIATCTGIFLYSESLKTEARERYSSRAAKKLEDFQRDFVMSWESIRNGRYHTILLSTLNHNNLSHFAFNMFALWGFGRTIIALFGVPAFTALFVGSAVTGGMAQYYYWDKTRDYRGRAAGASGAIFGVMTAMTFAMPRHAVYLLFVPMPMWAGLGISVVASVAGMKGVWGSQFGHADHLGGMAFGALFWLLVLRRRPGGWMPYYP
ncbi:hypothetical protein EG329_010844 [Mollisiaceae sp. DMI_Dod_QoI]|nr:hypothetical protein EG329_010844 [Helotiales sp. DMI_Dod_QoI]